MGFSPQQLSQQALRVEGRRDQRRRREQQEMQYAQSRRSNNDHQNDVYANAKDAQRQREQQNLQNANFMRHPAYSSPQYYNSLEKNRANLSGNAPSKNTPGNMNNPASQGNTIDRNEFRAD